MKEKTLKIVLAILVGVLALAAVFLLLFNAGEGTPQGSTPAGGSTGQIITQPQVSTVAQTENTTQSTAGTENTTASPETTASRKPEEKVYTIRYIGLDGADHSNPKTYTDEIAGQITLTAPSNRSGYQFAGWYLGETLVTSLAGRKGNLTLAAKWVPENSSGIVLPVVPF